MPFKKFPANTRTTINWASGTSTQIFIYPPEATFAERNFLFRISTATVEAEESTFTFFEGITRHLMILKGELQLIHEGKYTKNLKQFDQDTFSGEWKTRSTGRVTDFNLMLKGGTRGSLRHQKIRKRESAAFSSTSNFDFVFVVSGEAELSDGIVAREGDLVQFEKETEANFYALTECQLIKIEVALP